jgi:MFS family permease
LGHLDSGSLKPGACSCQGHVLERLIDERLAPRVGRRLPGNVIQTARVRADSSHIIRTYLLIAGIYTLSASLIWGVNTLFLLDAGLDIYEVFVANAAFTAGMVIFEIPTGVVADTRGRRLSFLFSAVTLAIGTLAYVSISALGGGLLLFIGASIFLGLGFSFYSGAVEAWLVDGLNAAGYEGQLDHVFARGSMVSGAAMLIGTVGGGVLGNVDLAWPFVGRAILLGVVFLIALRWMHDVGFTPHAVTLSEMPVAMKGILRSSITFGWRRRSVRLLMIVSFIQGGFIMWGFYAWQPYFLELLGRDAVWVAGVVAALIALSTIAGNGLVEFLTRFCGRRTTLLLSSAAGLALATIGVGLATSFWVAVVLLLVSTAASGVGEPVKHAYLHQVIPSEERATVVSFDSLMSSAGGIGGQMGLGYLARAQSIATGYVTGGVALLATLPVLVVLRAMKEPADSIVGQRAGRPAPCAAQGLPEISTVDSTARQPVSVA